MNSASGFDVIVIGGGLHGCATALHLARRGQRVLVLEREAIARHASGANAGGVRRLGRHLAEVPLSVAALELWYRLPELVGEDGGFVPGGGQLRIAETDAELAQLAARAGQMRTLGYTHEELVDRSELRAIVPAVSPHCVGGLISRADGFASPYHTTTAFHRAAERAGVRFEVNVEVVALDYGAAGWCVHTQSSARSRESWRARSLVNCAGAWGGKIATLLGDEVPLIAESLMMMVTERVAPFLAPTVGCVGRALSCKQLKNGTVLIGGGHRGAIEADGSTRARLPAIMTSAQTASTIFPCLRDARVVRTWAAIEGFFPDDIPVIGRAGTAPDAYHAFGFCGHGFELGPLVGRLIAELMLDGAASLPIEPFAVGRFARQ